MINVNDISECETNEENIIRLITVKSKDNNNIVIDKVIKGDNNIHEVLVIIKKPLET